MASIRQKQHFYDIERMCNELFDGQCKEAVHFISIKCWFQLSSIASLTKKIMKCPRQLKFVQKQYVSRRYGVFAQHSQNDFQNKEIARKGSGMLNDFLACAVSSLDSVQVSSKMPVWLSVSYCIFFF